MNRVLNTLDRLIDDNGLYGNPKLTDEAIEDLLKAREAVEKQIAKKPKKVTAIFFKMELNSFYYELCKREFSGDEIVEKFNYCPHCGTKIDWSEE